MRVGVHRRRCGSALARSKSRGKACLQKLNAFARFPSDHPRWPGIGLIACCGAKLCCTATKLVYKAADSIAVLTPPSETIMPNPRSRSQRAARFRRAQRRQARKAFEASFPSPRKRSARRQRRRGGAAERQVGWRAGAELHRAERQRRARARPQAVQAKDPQEAFALQSEFLKTQSPASVQAREIAPNPENARRAK